MQATRFCQSCGMPMGDTDALNGTNADGTRNTEYCKYCFENGRFHKEETMEQMLESCIPFMVEGGMSAEEARRILSEQLPQLKRWRKE